MIMHGLILNYCVGLLLAQTVNFSTRNTTGTEYSATGSTTVLTPPALEKAKIVEINEHTGTNLSCYICGFDRSDNKLLRDVNCLFMYESLHLIQCSSSDRYCITIKEEVWDQVQTLERGCASVCPYGCRYVGWTLTTRTCISCCASPGCNDQLYQRVGYYPGLSISSTSRADWLLVVFVYFMIVAH